MGWTVFRDFLVNLAAGIVGDISSPSGLIGYFVGLGFLVYGIVMWHRKRAEQGKRGLDSWYFIALAGFIAITAIGATGYGIGLRVSNPGSLKPQPASQPPFIAPSAAIPPKIITAPADVPKKLAAIDDLRKILNEEMLPWINSGQQLSTGGWWNWYVSDQIPQMQDAARNLYVKSQELDQEIQHLQNANVQFPDIQALASSPLGTPFLLKIQNLVTPILALPNDPSKKMGNDLYRFLFEPYAKETYAALTDIQNWRGQTDRNALELRKQLSQ